MIPTRTELTQTLVLARRFGTRLLRDRTALLLALCITVGAAVAGALGMFSLSVQQALDEDVAEFLGAPLVVQSKRPIDDGFWTAHADLRMAQTASFTTGAVGPGRYHSVALKAVSAGYPVQGLLRIRDRSGDVRDIRGAPPTNGIWLDKRAMAELGAQIGDSIRVGQAEFVVDAELLFEPDRLTQLQYTLPRSVIALSDLDKTGIDKANGLGDFRYLFDGTPGQLAALEESVTATLAVAHELLKPTAGSHPLARLTQRADRFIAMVIVLVTVLCGGAAAALADFMTRRYALPAAALRCLGVERRIVSSALLLQLGLLAVMSSVVGMLLGWSAQPLLARSLQPHLTTVSGSFSVVPMIMCLTVALVTVFAFVQPRLSALGRVPVVSALRGQTVLVNRNLYSFLAAGFVVTAVLWWYSDNAVLTLILSAGVFGVVGFAAAFGWALNLLAGQFHRVAKGTTRIALRAVSRSPGSNIAPLVTIALAVMAFMVTDMLRGEFLNAYHSQRLTHDGNYLFTDLSASEAEEFKSTVRRLDARVVGSYPTVRARLAAINGTPVDEALTRESDTREEIRSPVRLSWAESLPDNNLLLEGTWPTSKFEVSVDREVIGDLGLAIGDSLQFATSEESTVTAEITSIRTFRGGGSATMFWFMFAPAALAAHEQQYIGGLEITENPQSVLAVLNNEFPNVVVMELEQYLAQLRATMGAVTGVIDTLTVILLIAASVVVLATALTNSSARRRRSAMLRAIGASRAQLSFLLIIEYGTVGLVGGAIGVMGAHLVAAPMFNYQFAIPYEIEWFRYAALPLVTALGFIVLGYLFGIGQLRQTPMRVLQQT